MGRHRRRAGEKVQETRNRLAAALGTGKKRLGRVKERAIECSKTEDNSVHIRLYQAIGINFGGGHAQRLNELPTIQEEDESIAPATGARAPVAGRKAKESIPFVQGSSEVMTVGFHPIANGQAME